MNVGCMLEFIYRNEFLRYILHEYIIYNVLHVLELYSVLSWKEKVGDYKSRHFIVGILVCKIRSLYFILRFYISFERFVIDGSISHSIQFTICLLYVLIILDCICLHCWMFVYYGGFLLGTRHISMSEKFFYVVFDEFIEGSMRASQGAIDGLLRWSMSFGDIYLC